MPNPLTMPRVTYVWNRYHEATPTKAAVIELRVYYNGKAKYMSTGIFVYPKEWSARDYVVGRPDAIEINKQLRKLIAEVWKVINQMYDDGLIDIYAIPSKLLANRKPFVTFLDFCEDKAEKRKYGMAPHTQYRYDCFLRFLKNYGKIKTFYDITDAKIMELDKYLIKRKLKQNSRWSNYHRFMNSFILDAKKEGLVTVNPYDMLRIEKGDDGDATDRCLTPDEFRLLRDAKMSCDRLVRVHDRFIFQCYTGVGVKDLHIFEDRNYKRNIKMYDGMKVYAAHRGKTKRRFMFPILLPAQEILDKYGGTLPKISDQKYNDYLKEVAKEAKLPYPLTNHWARHTLGTLLANAGVSVEIIAKVLGDTIKQVEKTYAKWLPSTIASKISEIQEIII